MGMGVEKERGYAVQNREWKRVGEVIGLMITHNGVESLWKRDSLPDNG